ncbi:MAG TPA: transglutaminase family protein, partial [Tepidisphaeraceae bacterium]
MAIRVALNHKTRYTYAHDVWLSPHLVRLRPAVHCRTPITSYTLSVTPAEHNINWQQDPYGNRLARLVFPKKTRELVVEVDLIAELTVINPFDFFLENGAEQFPFTYDEVLKRELAPYLETLPGTPKLAAMASSLKGEGKPTISFLVDLNQKVRDAVGYTIRLEPGIQTPEQTLTCATGSCRDSSWLLVQLLRELGLAARFVSGYLIQLAPDVKPIDGPAGAANDFTDLHAWAEVYIPGAGWVGLDPTSGLLAGEGHIPLACTADPSNAAAVSGGFSLDNADIVTADADNLPPAVPEGEDSFAHTMSITRLIDAPRVTKPYTEAQWQQIDAVGQKVDQDLFRNDVRLTMGGEPTFVSDHDFDSPQWNTDAFGDDKYALGDSLARRLRDRFTVGGFLHHGQGKWYPGEPLPRWATGIYWRKDGRPIWRNPALMADESKDNKCGPEDARAFMLRLAERLGIERRYVVPGYEDVWYYLWKERKLPTNVDPFDSKLDDEKERKRLTRIFEQGLDQVVGYALPLRRGHGRHGLIGWLSGPWFLRAERMYLVPGDSPMGFRLPLDSIPWSPPGDLPFLQPEDPWDEHPPLPSFDDIAKRRYVSRGQIPPWPDRFKEHRVEQTLDPVTPIATPVPAEQGAYPSGAPSDVVANAGGAAEASAIEPPTKGRFDHNTIR